MTFAHCDVLDKIRNCREFLNIACLNGGCYFLSCGRRGLRCHHGVLKISNTCTNNLHSCDLSLGRNSFIKRAGRIRNTGLNTCELRLVSLGSETKRDDNIGYIRKIATAILKERTATSSCQ